MFEIETVGEKVLSVNEAVSGVTTTAFDELTVGAKAVITSEDVPGVTA